MVTVFDPPGMDDFERAIALTDREVEAVYGVAPFDLVEQARGVIVLFWGEQRTSPGRLGLWSGSVRPHGASGGWQPWHRDIESL